MKFLNKTDCSLGKNTISSHRLFAKNLKEYKNKLKLHEQYFQNLTYTISNPWLSHCKFFVDENYKKSKIHVILKNI